MALILQPSDDEIRQFEQVRRNRGVAHAADEHALDNGTDHFDATSPRALLTLSITTIRAELGGKNFPIEENGQMFDIVTNSQPGGNEPSAAEITGDMQAAKDLGCIGISFFDWRTASPDELSAFQQFTW